MGRWAHSLSPAQPSPAPCVGECVHTRPLDVLMCTDILNSSPDPHTQHIHVLVPTTPVSVVPAGSSIITDSPLEGCPGHLEEVKDSLGSCLLTQTPLSPRVQSIYLPQPQAPLAFSLFQKVLRPAPHYDILFIQQIFMGPYCKPGTKTPRSMAQPLTSGNSQICEETGTGRVAAGHRGGYQGHRVGAEAGSSWRQYQGQVGEGAICVWWG